MNATTKKLGMLVAAATMLALGTGCSAATTAAAPRTAVPYETRQLAPGVELRIAPDASPGARQAADQLQAEYQSTYLNAR
jgi:hypothetical protein